MLGVIIGVGLGRRPRRRRPGRHDAASRSSSQSLGTNLLTVNPGSATTASTRGAAGSATTLTIDDAAAIAKLAGVAAVAPELSTPAARRRRHQEHDDLDRRHDARLPHGPQLRRLAGLVPDRTRPIDRGLRVAVLGATTADDLGLGADADRHRRSRSAACPFQVVGILQAKGGAGPLNQDDQILVPLTTVAQLLRLGRLRSGRSASASRPPTRSTSVKAEITTLLKTRHALGADRHRRLHDLRPGPAADDRRTRSPGC